MEAAGGDRAVDGNRAAGCDRSEREHDRLVEIVVAATTGRIHRTVGDIDPSIGCGGDWSGRHIAADQRHEQVSGGDVAGDEAAQRREADFIDADDIADGDRSGRRETDREIVDRRGLGGGDIGKHDRALRLTRRIGLGGDVSAGDRPARRKVEAFGVDDAEGDPALRVEFDPVSRS